MVAAMKIVDRVSDTAKNRARAAIPAPVYDLLKRGYRRAWVEADRSLRRAGIEQRLPPMLDYLDCRIPAEGFVFGDFSMADLSIVSPFVNAAYAGYEVDADRWPSVAGLIATVKEVPAVKSILEQEAKVLGFS